MQSMQSVPEQRFRRCSRRGIAIVMALVILGIVLVLAYIYNFTSRQSKLASRRMFWGETTYFIVDSMVEEVFHKIKTKPIKLFKEKLLANEGSDYVSLDLQLKSNSLEVAYGMGLSLEEIKILAKVISIEADLQFDESDSIGVIEVVVTAKIKSKLGKAITRQVTARRDFRYVTLFGDKLRQDYALFLKQVSSSRDPNDYNYGLTVETHPGTSGQALNGKIYLGGPDKMSNRHILNSSNYSEADLRYLEEAGIDSDTFTDPSVFQKGVKSAFFLDVLVHDNALDDAFRKVPSRPNLSRENAQGWVESFFRMGAGEASIKFEIAADQDPDHNALPLRIESPSGPGLRVEGSVFREYKYSVNTEYKTGSDDDIKSELIISHKVPQAALYGNDPFGQNFYPLFSNNEAIENKELTRTQFLPYNEGKDFAQVYPYRKGKAWDIAKDNILMPMADGSQILNIDGIVAIVADEVIFDRKTFIRGQGVLLVLGKIRILESIIAKNPDVDRLVLVSRAERGGAIVVETSKEIQAYLMCHSFSAKGFKGTVSTALSAFNVFGGISADTLNFFKLKQGSRLKYNPKFMDDQPKLILAKSIHYYKIYNNEKIEPDS